MQVPLDSWQIGPHNRWAYQHVDEMVPTVVVPRGDGPVRELPSRPARLDVGGPRHPTSTGSPCCAAGRWCEERYRNGMDATRCTSRSPSASPCSGCSSACCGIDPATPVTEHVPEVAGSGYDGATVQHLLDMTAAIDFVEDYADFWRYDVACAWHPPHPGVRGDDPRVPAHDRARARGGTASASTTPTPNTDLLGIVAERAGGAPLAELIARELWAPLGAEHDALLTVDHAGHGRDRRRLLRHAARLRAARRSGARGRLRARRRRLLQPVVDDRRQGHRVGHPRAADRGRRRHRRDDPLLVARGGGPRGGAPRAGRRGRLAVGPRRLSSASRAAGSLARPPCGRRWLWSRASRQGPRAFAARAVERAVGPARRAGCG